MIPYIVTMEIIFCEYFRGLNKTTNHVKISLCTIPVLHGLAIIMTLSLSSRAHNEEECVTSGVRVPGGNLLVCLNLE